MASRNRRLLTLWLLALTLACFDLWVKIVVPTPDWAFHHRSASWAVGCTVLLVAVIPLSRLPSNAVTIGAGFFSGGVLGNLISGATDHLAVPNPLLLATHEGAFAFNLADAFILIGNLILIISLCLLAIRHRDQLRGPVAFARARHRPPSDR